jgi:hypothetical protein
MCVPCNNFRNNWYPSFEVLTVVNLSTVVVWGVMMCGLIARY